MRYVLSYDIQKNWRRARLANLLLGYGERVQYSVFEANLSAADLARLLARVFPLLDEEDSFCVYPLCRDCQLGIRRLGAKKDDPLADQHVIIV